MKKITDLSHYRNKKLLITETQKLTDYILEQAKQGTAIHTVEQGIWDKLLTMVEQVWMVLKTRLIPANFTFYSHQPWRIFIPTLTPN